MCPFFSVGNNLIENYGAVNLISWLNCWEFQPQADECLANYNKFSEANYINAYFKHIMYCICMYGMQLSP